MEQLSKREKIIALLEKNNYSVNAKGKISDNADKDFDFEKISDLLPILTLIEEEFSATIDNSILTKNKREKSNIDNLTHMLNIALNEVGEPLMKME